MLVGWSAAWSVGRSPPAFMAMLMGNGKDHSPLEESPQVTRRPLSRVYSPARSRRLSLPPRLIICKSERRHFSLAYLRRLYRSHPSRLIFFLVCLLQPLASFCPITSPRSRANTEIVHYINHIRWIADCTA